MQPTKRKSWVKGKHTLCLWLCGEQLTTQVLVATEAWTETNDKDDEMAIPNVPTWITYQQLATKIYLIWS